MQPIDLTQRPPRSPRVRLGGYVILPRMLDKCRAEIAGKNGDYHYNCPLDQYFLNYVGVNPESLKAKVAEGLGDSEVLEWISQNALNKRHEWDIELWSRTRETAAPSGNESRGFVNEIVSDAGGAAREDVSTWFDVLDLDDHVTAGGKA